MEDKIYITEDEFLTLLLAVSSLRDDLELAAKSDYVVKKLFILIARNRFGRFLTLLIESRKNSMKRLKYSRKRWKRAVSKFPNT